ncbi:MAG TPA: DinB family protein [Longilinea sp.]|nr:DinB family protein [Longilinea sp.]
MTLILLVDLDGTLIFNDIERFLPAYLQKLSNHLKDRVAPTHMVRSLLAGTKAMEDKELPDKTLEQAFDGVFYPEIGISKAKISESLSFFYERIYPDLQNITTVIPEAQEFVKWAFSQNYTIAIATNPLFPRSAIEQRLAWAGLPVSEYPFALVTSFEKFHFAKPNPAYYAEILGQLGWPDIPAVMVGNSLSDDILPAQAIGVPAFQLQTPTPSDHSSSEVYSELMKWIKEKESAHLSISQTPEALTALLTSTPAALSTLASSVDRDNWNKRPRSNEWSLGEIFCHLRDVDTEVTLPRTLRILQENSPFITAEETDVWAEQRNYLQEDASRALDGFIDARIHLLQALMAMKQNDWLRPARHAIFGPTTLSELLVFTVTHDQNHIRQIAKTIQWLKRK